MVSARVCVIGIDTADALFPHRDPIDQELTVNGRAYRVIGVFEKKGAFFGGSNDNFVAVPITAFDDQFPEVKNGGGDTIHIATVPKRPEDYEALIEEGTAILRTRRGLRPNQVNDFFNPLQRRKRPLGSVDADWRADGRRASPALGRTGREA